MKKLLLPFLMVFALILGGCANKTEEKAAEQPAEPTTFTYSAETGPIEVPSNPQRVVLLSGFTGNVIKLGVPVVGVDQWSKANPNLTEQLKDVAEISDESLEQIIELKPDLIIGLSNIKNLDKLQAIAPTVTYTWGKLNYLDQHIEIGKLLNKEEEARAWVEDFKKRSADLGAQIKTKIGEDATVSVIEAWDKQLYVYGNNWARGTEVLYQAMGLKMPEEVVKNALEPGYYAISAEVMPKFAGDYVILSKYDGADIAFQETETYKNIPAVKNNQVFEMKGDGASFSDPITVELHLEFFKKSFLGE